MATIFSKRRPPVGSRPGTLAVPPASTTTLDITRYSPAHHATSTAHTVDEIAATPGAGMVTWIDVRGLGNEATLRALGSKYGIHPLALEDVVNAPQRPKVEDYPGHVLFIARMARLCDGDLDVQQVGIIVGSDFVLTFHEGAGVVLDPVRVRIREGKGMIRQAGAGYLAYAIIDTIIDAYYPVIEDYSAQIERIEHEISGDSTPTMLRELEQLKSQLVVLRRGLWPQLEAVGRLLREDARLVTDEVRLYLRDTHDHCAQLVDVLDSQRELVGGLVNTHLSLVAHRTNEVMKVLTIVSTIFIPLTFIVGLYGMNFTNMPEIHSRWGYPIVVGIMAVAATAMVIYFRRRGWLRRGGGGDPS